MMSIRVVSYNVLVPIYADQPDFYIHSDPRYLKTNYRWNLIKSQLEQEITNHQNTIICLQELSRTLLSDFEELFKKYNYTLHYCLYGGPHNDYMGVGIAVPASMHVNKRSMIKIGGYIRSMTRPRGAAANMVLQIRSLCDRLARKAFKQSIDPWDIAMARNNTLVCLRVTFNGKQFCIGTYHMPCLYETPDVMIIHVSVVKDLMFHLADGRDFIFTGDFNTEPHNACYHILTRRDFSEYRFPGSKSYQISYQPNAKQILKSAYREKNGKEPAYTNYTHPSGMPLYCETIDYIFFSGRIQVENVLKLPDEPKGKSYPDETHPSDHIMIAATLRLQ